MKKEDLLKEAEEVIKTTRFERDHITTNRNNLGKTELEISKTVISANKNIVSALIVAKGLMQNGETD